MVNIQEAKSAEEILECFPVVKELRPHLQTKEEFSSKVQLQQGQGYHLLYIKDDDSKLVVSICGYRIQNFLWSGKTLYVDDLCTSSAARGKGHGRALLEWAKAIAKEENCEYYSLDSGYTRNAAHRLYLNCGFIIDSHHFGMKL